MAKDKKTKNKKVAPTVAKTAAAPPPQGRSVYSQGNPMPGQSFSQGNPMPGQTMYSQGSGPIPGQTMYSQGGPMPGQTMYSQGSQAYTYAGASMTPATSDKVKDKKKKKNKKGDELTLASPTLTADQINQLQIEEAIKESNNPSLKLKKLKHPLSWKSFFFSLLLIVLITFVIALIWIVFSVDNFNFLHIMTDIFNKSGISEFFIKLGNWFSGNGFVLALSIL